MGKKNQAQLADKYALYEDSVQDPSGAIGSILEIYRSQNERMPLVLREDFCGTAALCTHWVKSDNRRQAIGIDIHHAALEWGRKKNIAPLGAPFCYNVELHCCDVLYGCKTKADCIVAFNFSYWVFHQSKKLKMYFKTLPNALNPGGLFLLDVYGGPAAQYQLREQQENEEYSYIWEQKSFDPIANRMTCAIHFEFPDGSKLQDAFVYDWRAWTLPELKELLLECRFSRADVWWEGQDGLLRPTESAESRDSWVAYIAAWK